MLDDSAALRLIRLFGKDRVLFGTDFPMWRAIPEIQNLLSLGLPDRTLKKIFSCIDLTTLKPTDNEDTVLAFVAEKKLPVIKNCLK